MSDSENKKTPEERTDEALDKVAGGGGIARRWRRFYDESIF